MNNVANVMEWIARWGLTVTVLLSPWYFGGFRLSDQFWIYSAVVLCYALWWVSQLVRGRGARLAVPWVLLLSLLYVGIGVWQLLPSAWGQPSFDHAVFGEWMGTLHSGPISIEPASTRLAVIKFGMAFLTTLLAVQVFQTTADRRRLWWALCANGACLAAFGITQAISWNGSLFWSVPLRYGGQAFASYVNRNNASGYLCLCLCAGFGALAILGAPEGSVAALRARLKKINLPRTPRSWDTAEIITLILTATTFVGVFASLSRGGMVAGVLTFALGTLMLWAILGNRAIVYGVVFLLIPIAGVIWLNLNQSIGQRLETLTEAGAVRSDGRWRHWSDTLKALPDAPAGSGLGTYRYLNRPYQQHAARGWYYNADNQYVETLVELGPAGLLVLAVCIGFVIRAACMTFTNAYEGDLRDVAVVLATLVVSQADLAFTDFGIIMPANLLTTGLIMGACFGPIMQSERSTAPEARGWGAILLGMTMVTLPATGLAEVHLAAAQSEFIDRLPDMRQLEPTVDPEQTRTLITEGEALLEKRPDNASMHLALAELWFLQLRHNVARQLESLNPDLHSSQAWGVTSPTSLYRQTLELSRTGDSAALEAIRSDSAVVESLIPAWTHLQKAHAACPYLPQTHFLMGCLCPLMGESEMAALAHFRHEVALSPFETGRLISAGLVIHATRDQQSAAILWKRALTLNPESAHHVFQFGLPLFPPLVFLEQVIPDSPGVLLYYIEHVTDEAARDAADERLGRLLPQEMQASPYENWIRGRVAMLRNRWEEAASALQLAANGSPYQIDYLVDLVTTLEKLERWDQACTYCQRLLQLDPENANYNAWMNSLFRQREIDKGLKSVPRGDATTSSRASRDQAASPLASTGQLRASLWKQAARFPHLTQLRSPAETGVGIAC